MKNLHFLLFSLIFLQFSCDSPLQNVQTAKEDSVSTASKKPLIKPVLEREIIAKNGIKCRKTVFADSDDAFQMEYFDSSGLVVRQKMVGKLSKEMEVRIRYNSKGQEIDRQVFSDVKMQSEAISIYRDDTLLLMHINLHGNKAQADTVFYFYDNKNRLDSTRDNHYVSVFRYNERGFLKEKTMLERGKKLAGDRAEVYAYDENGWLISMSFKTSGGDIEETAFQYDSIGHLMEKSMTNSIGKQQTIRYEYDLRGLVIKATERTSIIKQPAEFTERVTTYLYFTEILDRD